MSELPQAGDLSLEEQVALLSGQNQWQTRAIPGKGVPAVHLSDGPHGLRMQPDVGDHLGLSQSVPATCFPTAVTLASSWDEDLLEEVGRALGDEAAALGVAVVLGPGLNIKRHPLCGRNFEYLSEDPLLSGRLAAAMVKGVQHDSVGACLKHFAVNNQEGHRFVVDAVVDGRTLREIYLAGFEHAVTEAAPRTVMAAYNRVNGPHATAHRELLTEILRAEWGFDGLVMSDWGATADRVAGVRAGMDLEMPGSGQGYDADVLAAVRSGELDAADVRTSAQRVLDLVRVSPAPGVDQIRLDALVDDHDDHDALARRAAAEGTVLLTNDGVLPLRPVARVAVVGAFAEQPRYQGHGSSHVTPTRVTTALDAFRARGLEVAYAPGYDVADPVPDARRIAEAVAAARDADVAVVLVGLPGSYESEGFDRDHLRLPAQHDELVRAVAAANPRTVVALSNGSPVLMPWRDDVAAVLECYLGGQAGGAALVDVLLGDVEPGGRLAETFPARLEDVAADPWFPGDPHQVEYREGLFVGYRHHTSAGLEPLFPFGHGLGYATFAWDGADLDRSELVAGDSLTVSVDVTCTGERAGSEVVQVYLHDRTAVVLRPRRWLAGYAKVRLAPGETRRVEVTVPRRSFAFWDTSTRSWAVPKGDYEVEVGRSSTDIVTTLPVRVAEGVASAPEGPDVAPVAAADADFARRLGRPVPAPAASTPFSRESTLGEISTHPLGRAFVAVVRRLTPVDEETKQDRDAMLMVERSLVELPLRAAVLFSGGALSWRVVDGLVALLNATSRRRRR